MLLLLDHDVGVVVVLFIKNCLDKKVISLSTFIRDVNKIKNKSHFFCFFCILLFRVHITLCIALLWSVWHFMNNNFFN